MVPGYSPPPPDASLFQMEESGQIRLFPTSIKKMPRPDCVRDRPHDKMLPHDSGCIASFNIKNTGSYGTLLLLQLYYPLL